MTALSGNHSPDTWREIIAQAGRRRRRRRRALWIVAAAVAVVAAPVFWISQLMVAPARPRISSSHRPVLGLLLREVEGAGVVAANTVSPAREAGLRPGDRILGLDGEPVRTVGDVRILMQGVGEGDLVRVEARRPEPEGGQGGVLVDVRVEVRPVSPKDLGLDYVDVEFLNPAGLTLRGWFLPAPSDAPAPGVVYGHGNSTDRRHWLDGAWEIHHAGFAQLLFDFSGRGESDGEVITLGAMEAKDLRAALDYLGGRREIDPSSLFLVARSMGAAAAILAAAEGAPVRGIVLDSPFTDLARLADETIYGAYLPAWPLRPLAFKLAGWRAGYDPGRVRPIDVIGKIGRPILILHGTEDRVVRFDHAKDLVAAAQEGTRLVPLEGLGHNDRRPARVSGTIIGFLYDTFEDR